MSLDDGPAVGTYDAPTEPWPQRLFRWFPPVPTLAVVIAVASVAVTALPDLHFAHWDTAIVVAGALVAVGLAAPAHVDAITALRGPLDPIVLASLTALLCVAWTITPSEPDDVVDVWSAVVVGALLCVTGHVRRTSGTHGARGAAPAWSIAVTALVAIGAGLGWLVLNSASSGWTRGVTTLVGAGICSIVLAHTVPTLSARSQARRQGVHIQDQADLARLASIDTLILQQDGTVTTGRLKVDSVQAVERDHDRNLRWFAGALSHAGDHPISRALAHLSGHGRLSEVSVIDGRGIAGTVDRHPVRVGDPRWLGLAPVEHLWRTVAVEVDARVLGTVTVMDELRDDAAEQVSRLHELGITVHVVSTSRPDRAEHIARVVGLERIHSMPIGQLADTLRDAGSRVAAVSDQPVTADVVLSARLHDGVVRMDDLDVGRVAVAISMARSVVSTRRRARLVAAVVGVVGAGLGVTGLIGPGVASGVAVLGAMMAAVAARPSTPVRR